MPIPYLRSDHRTAVTNGTYGKLTTTATLDLYINEAELEVIAEIATFFPQICSRVRQSGSTDASGLLLMSQGFNRFLRLEDVNKIKYDYIDSIDKVWSRAGWVWCGFDQTNKKYQIQVYYNNATLASTTLYWWDNVIVGMLSGASDVSAVPDGWKQLINYKALMKYYMGQGSSMAPEMEKWMKLFSVDMAKCKQALSTPQTDPEWIQSADSDAGEAGGTLIHIVS